MFKFELNNLGFEYTKYWCDTRRRLEKVINAHVYICYDNHFEEVKVMISLKSFNYVTSFYFPYDIKDTQERDFDIIEMIKTSLKFRIYQDAFFVNTNEIGG